MVVITTPKIYIRVNHSANKECYASQETNPSNIIETLVKFFADKKGKTSIG